tara:strand:- start:63 stop:1199 length:1137 start_codon:yes stop_codon:yes gene_type:complete
MTSFTNQATLNIDQIGNVLKAKAMHAPRPRPTIIIGEKGIGKTAGARKMFEATNGHFDRLLFVDGAATNQGDSRLPVINPDGTKVMITPTNLFTGDSDKPILIVVDEIGKMSRPALNETHSILEPLPHVGTENLPEGSMVVATSNFVAEGLGDVLLDHTLDRADVLIQRKSTNDEWVDYALMRGVHGVVVAFAKDTPEAFQSAFTDGGSAENNTMITNPKYRGKQGKVVTPRGLEAAGDAVTMAELAGLSDDETRAQLQGIIGIEGAAKLDAQLAYNKELPSWDEMCSNPKGCRVPETAGARSVLLFSALARMVHREHAGRFGAVATLVARMGDSWSDILMKHTMLHKPNQHGSDALWDAAQATPHMREWTLANMDLL